MDAGQNRFAGLAQPSTQSPQMGNSASAATSPQPTSNPTLSALEDGSGQQGAEAEVSDVTNRQYGSFDLGHGWVDTEDEFGYVYEPQGQYVFSEPHF